MSDVAIVVASGGMDSATLAYHFHTKGYEVHLLGFDYGQRHSKELDHLKQLADHMGVRVDVVDMTVLRDFLAGSSLTSSDVTVPDGHYAEETMRITVVPNRNMIMLSIAAGVAVSRKARVVATGVHAGDHYIYPDCRPEFVEATERAIWLATEGHADENFVLDAPFVEWSKTDIAAYGNKLGVPYELTWSCYKGGEVHCGSCGTCFERREAFRDAQVPDPTEYLATPDYDNPLES